MSDPANIVIPPLGRHFAVAYWLESIFYGMNVLLFMATMYILLRRRKIHYLLVASSVFLFMLATAHIGVSLHNLLAAFTDPAVTSLPHGTDLWFTVTSRSTAVTASGIYVVTVSLQDVLLIWRLYVVWEKKWKICILPAILETVHNGAAIATLILVSNPENTVLTPSLRAAAITTWVTNLVLYIGLTTAIAYRLWWADRRLRTLYTGASRYTPALLTIVESGFLFASATLVVVILTLVQHPSVVAATSPTAQLATMSPLLIVVRAGLGLGKGSAQNSTVAATVGPSQSKLAKTEVSITRFEESRSDYAMNALSKKGTHSFNSDTMDV